MLSVSADIDFVFQKSICRVCFSFSNWFLKGLLLLRLISPANSMPIFYYYYYYCYLLFLCCLIILKTGFWPFIHSPTRGTSENISFSLSCPCQSFVCVSLPLFYEIVFWLFGDFICMVSKQPFFLNNRLQYSSLRNWILSIKKKKNWALKGFSGTLIPLWKLFANEKILA